MSQPKTQRGFLLITAVVLVVVVSLLVGAMAFMFVAGSQSGADHLQSSQALFIAEAGLEKALRQKTLSGAYTGETNTPYANGSFTITFTPSPATDFSGTSLLSGWYRITSVGTTSSGGASRTVEAIVGPKNLFPPAANADFNSPACPAPVTPACAASTPTNWLPDPVNPPIWDINGGPETPPTRAASALKATNGPAEVTSAGSFTFTPAIVVTAPTTLTLTFNYKVVTTGMTSKEVEMTFALGDGVTTWTSAPNPFQTGNTGTYQSGVVTFSITGVGVKSINQLSFSLVLKSGQSKQAWIDNLSLNSGGGSGLAVRYWREDFF